MISFKRLKNIELSPDFNFKIAQLNLKNIQVITLFGAIIFFGLMVLDFLRYQKGVLFENEIYFLLFLNHFAILLLFIPYIFIQKNKSKIIKQEYPNVFRVVIFWLVFILLICLPMTVLSLVDRGSITMYAVFILSINFIVQLKHKDRIYFNVICLLIVSTAIFIINKDNSIQLIISFLEVLGLTVPAFLIATARYNDQIIQFENEQELEKKNKETDTLLLNILPFEIAEELKKNGKVEPKRYASASILFTDIVNFSQLSEQRSPEQIALELDKCFREFDKIMKEYGLEKIKTIGDAYMCVSGVPKEDVNHAKKIIQAATAMQKWLKKEVDWGNQFANMRIGIHSGPVVAGVVGVDKFAYDIWGKSVNIAARIESAGEPLKINISAATYELIEDEYECEFRGEIKVKNMGKINMYFVSGFK